MTALVQCQCPKLEADINCTAKATAEDFLCDFCRNFCSRRGVHRFVYSEGAERLKFSTTYVERVYGDTRTTVHRHSSSLMGTEN